MAETLLTMSAITKRFPGVLALDGVSLTVGAGEIHALLGENGAGKSTLLKILAGAQQPDAGEILFDGKRLNGSSPSEVQKRGIVTIYQEFTLSPDLSVAENIFIGRQPLVAGFVNWPRMIAESRTLMERIGLTVSPNQLVKDLSVAEQQLVEIARALSMRSRLIIMDEPTSALSGSETERLFAIARDLKAHGVSTVFVTHKLEEVMDICDRYTVMRDGRFVTSGDVADTTIDGLIHYMVGREVDSLFAGRVSPQPGPVVLKISHLKRASNSVQSIALHDISLEARAGEILGIAGLVGAGRTEVVRAIFGADPFDSGTFQIDGAAFVPRTPQDAIARGIALVPEDRKQQALFLAQAIRPNLSIATLKQLSNRFGFVDEGRESALIADYRTALQIKMSSPEQIVGNLSGGNQQKVVLARWMAMRPKVLIVDEPTRGIDIGAKVEVHNLLFELAQSGVAVIAISSELPEVLAISDRIITMRAGRITGEVARKDATQEKLMALMALERPLAA